MKLSLSIASIILLLGICFYIGNRVININYDNSLPSEHLPLNEKKGNLQDIIHEVNVDDLNRSFPYEKYIKTANLHSYQSINQDILLLDSLNPENKEENRDMLIRAFTTEIEKKVSPSFDVYNIDSLIMMYQWAVRFEYYKEMNTENDYLYAITYEHWMNYIANKLGQYYQNDSAIKYDYKYNYLTSICRSKKFMPPIGNAIDEKIIKYLSEQKYGYLFNRFWKGTGFLFKFLIFITGVVITYSVYYTITSAIKKITQ